MPQDEFSKEHTFVYGSWNIDFELCLFGAQEIFGITESETFLFDWLT